MKEIKISVIVPIYNVEKYLKRCIDSILEQDFRDYELILINDGSTDNSLEIAKSYCDDRIVLINKENEGLSATRNLGIKIAKGEYILHIDSDDWIEQSYFKNMYNLAKKKDADIVMTGYYIDYDNGKLIYISPIKEEIEDNIEFCKKVIKGEISSNMWTKLIRKRLYIENGIEHENSIAYGEDLVVMPRLMYYAKNIEVLEGAYVHYIQNPKSITHTFNLKSLFDLNKCCEILEEFFKEKNVEPVGLRLFHFNKFIYTDYRIFKDKSCQEVLSRYLQEARRVKLKNIYSYRQKFYTILLKLFNNIFILKVIHRIEYSILKIKNILRRR